MNNYLQRVNGLVRYALMLVMIVGVSSIFQACQDESLLLEEPSITNVQSAVGDEVSISNSGFESDFDGWSDTDPSSISSSDVNSGSKSAKITGSGGKIERSVSVNSNTDYTLQVYVLDSWRIGVSVDGVRTTRSGTASDWAAETVTFNTGSSTSISIFAEYNDDEGRFDDFSLTEGEGSGSTPPTGNLALNKSATQSSTSHGGGASRAVDGNTAGNWSAGSVTHTNGSEADHWWQVDLGSSNDIGEVVIYNRSDNCCTSRLSDFTVLVLNSSGNTTFSQTISSLSENSITIDAEGNSGRYIRIEKGGDALSLAEVEVYAGDGGGGSTPSYPSIPAKIEAEDFDDATEGRTESTSDSGGGSNVGWIDSGEYMSYNVNVPSSGTYTIDFRVASRSTGSNFDIYQGNSKVGSVSSSATGGWQTWETVSESVSLSSGDQTIKILATSGGWNFNWLEFSEGDSSGGGENPTEPGNAEIPSDLMENCNQWKITYPDGEEDKTLCGEANNEYWFVNDDKNAMVFRAPIRDDNGTTPNSDYVRSELREREEDGGSDIYWTTSGTHVVYVKQAITHLPIVKDHLVATQIHGNKDDGIDDAMVMRLEGSHLFLSFNVNKLRDDLTIKTNYSLGTIHEVIFEVIDGKHYCYYSEDGNLASAYASGNASGYLVKDNGNSVIMDLDYDESYFKIGNYTQSNPEEEGSYTDDPNNYGEVYVYDFFVDHQ